MIYHSPFDSIENRNRFSEIRREMHYQGTLDSLLEETKIALCAKETENLHVKILNPPRIIRGILDYKISCSLEGMEEFVSMATDIGLSVYLRREDALEKLNEFRRRVSAHFGKDMLNLPVAQKEDSSTWEASYPGRSEKSAELLKSQTNNSVLFIALAHGGVIAGMDVYLRYCSKTRNNDSSFYTVRFSLHKLKDEKPCLSQSEKTYLATLGKGKEVVIFDEDSFTGDTLSEAETYFSTQVFSNRRFLILSNMDKAKYLGFLT